MHAFKMTLNTKTKPRTIH